MHTERNLGSDIESALVTSRGFHKVRGIPGQSGGAGGGDQIVIQSPWLTGRTPSAATRAYVIGGEMRVTLGRAGIGMGEQSAHGVEVEAAHDGVCDVAVAAVMDVDLFERRRRLMENWPTYLAGESRDPRPGPIR